MVKCSLNLNMCFKLNKNTHFFIAKLDGVGSFYINFIIFNYFYYILFQHRVWDSAPLQAFTKMKHPIFFQGTNGIRFYFII